MRKATHILSFFILLMTLAGGWGCIKDNNDRTDGKGDDQSLVRMQVRVSGGASKSASTRAGGYSDTDISTIDVLSFRSDDRTFQYRARASVIDTAGEWFDIILNKSRDEQQILVVLANLSAELDTTPLFEGTTTIEDLRSSLSTNFIYQTFHDPNHTTQVPGQYGADRPLPMWGESEPLAIVDETMKIGTIYMLRSLAGVTVLINLDTSDPAQKPFRMVDVAIYNAVDKGYAIPDPNNLENYTTGTMLATAPTVYPGAVTSQAYFHSTDGSTVNGGIYLGEKTNKGTAQDDRTWLYVSGYYDDDTDITWYRLPFVDREGKQWDILRNHNYIFNIYKVTGSGNTEEEAKDADIYADVIPWNLGGESQFDIDGQYWIWVDPTSASYEIAGGTGTVTVETNYPGGVTASVSSSATERDVACDWLTCDATPTGSAINYTVLQTDKWASRTAYIHITAAGFAVTVRIDQAGMYVDGASVTPTGDIAGDGESRTLRLTGRFDDVQVRVMDVSNNNEITQAPANSFVPGNLSTGNPSQVTVVIPAWTAETSRQVAIQYYDKKINDWVTAQQSTQEGYSFQVGSNLGEGSTIISSNATYTINITGPSWPTLYVRAVIRGTQTVVTSPITIPAGTGASTSANITIGTYNQWTDGPTRPVELQYTRDNSNWTSAIAINYGNQAGSFSVTGSTIADPAIENGEDATIRAILPSGTNIAVTVHGNYASGWIQVRSVRAADLSYEVSATNPTITDISSRSVNLPISPNYNYTGDSKYGSNAGHRDIRFQYRRYLSDAYGNMTWETNWTTINVSDVQQLGYVTLSTGRVVAIEDVKSTHVPNYPDHFLWHEAMGIDPKYHNQGYPHAELSATDKITSAITRPGVPEYTQDYKPEFGGCAAYTEGGTSEKFYLPLTAEILEMSDRFLELGKIAYAPQWEYWFNREAYVYNDGIKTSLWTGFTYDLEFKIPHATAREINYGVGLTNYKRARCVRKK